MDKDRKLGVHLDEELEKMRVRLAQFEQELRSLGDKAGDQNVSSLMEEEELRRDVVELEKRLSRVEERTHELIQTLKGPSADGDALGDQKMAGKLKALQDRVKQMEDENKALGEVCSHLRQQNEAISNLYVAKHRLHATLNPSEVMKIIEEILIELIGAKEYGILILEQKSNTLRLVAGRGVEDRLPSKTIPAGEGVIGDVAATGKPFFFKPKAGAERSAFLPLATIPLKMDGKLMGVVVIFGLLPHKTGLTPIDHQLLELVAEHAPAALVSAHLYQTRGVKRQ
jgi:nitrate/nitrite-specific signal transduction histidine kinase